MKRENRRREMQMDYIKGTVSEGQEEREKRGRKGERRERKRIRRRQVEDIGREENGCKQLEKGWNTDRIEVKKK